MVSVSFFRLLAGKQEYRLGTAVESLHGWRFLSNTSSHGNSRKFHPTLEKCIPHWVGYPNKCVSRSKTVVEIK